MSYHSYQPRPLSGPSVVPPVPLLSLAQVMPAPAPAPDRMKQVLTLIAVVVVIAAILWWLDQQKGKALRPNNRSRVKKQSTAEMAKNLYKRLDARGGANDTTLRSLRALGANR